MSNALLIVESPAKAKTLGKYLGSKFKVLASVGHVKDLPKSKLGFSIEKGKFQPEYEAIKGKEQVLREITKAAKAADVIYLAPDPDREGEAIAWHIAEEIKAGLAKKPAKGKKAAAKKGSKSKPAAEKKIMRVLFFEITKKAVQLGLEKAGELNIAKFEAQQARRILDRIVGYRISPLLWDKVRRGLSAGRVQSVAVRIICDREAAIEAFKKEEYWSIEARFKGKKPPAFSARLLQIGKEKFASSSKKDTDKVLKRIEKEAYQVQKIETKDVRRKALPPFITSTLQQEAIKQLHFSAKKTMMIAQRLYEGGDVGGQDEGLITYMRTDSCRISDDALREARSYIEKTYGKPFLPEKPFIYKVRKDAHNAHEAIRPTSIARTPEKMKKLLAKDEYRLYRLIYARFIACQMNPAIYQQTRADILGGDFLFRANGRVKTFDGYLAAYQEKKEEGDEEEQEGALPPLREGETLKMQKLTPNQHFTQPPGRFSEASLVRELEEKGIGRPSTYAQILSNIVSRHYVAKDQGRFSPTDLGKLVNGLLVESFPRILEAQFTAKMEEELDQVEFGEKNWQDVLQEFNVDFEKALGIAKKKMRDVKREEIKTSHKCEKCKKPMVIKWGRNGHFLACSAYPECRTTKEIRFTEGKKFEIVKAEDTGEKCPNCKSAMVMKFGRFGRFLACSDYPKCKTTKSVSTGVPCPNDKCKGQLSEKRSRKGKMFYGCSKYPKCDYALWHKPVKKKCPSCDFPLMMEKVNKSGMTLECPSCKHKLQTEAGEEKAS